MFHDHDRDILLAVDESRPPPIKLEEGEEIRQTAEYSSMEKYGKDTVSLFIVL